MAQEVNMSVEKQAQLFSVRLPEVLKSWVKEAAHKNRRSMNAEIVVRLEESRKLEEGAPGAG